MAFYSRSSSPAETLFSVDYEHEELDDSQYVSEQVMSPGTTSLLPVADLSAESDRMAENQERNLVG